MGVFFASALTRNQLLSMADGRKCLTFLCQEAPLFSPEKYGNYEPLRLDFSCDRIDEALSYWGRALYWKRRRPHLTGFLDTGWGASPIHGQISIDIGDN